MIGLFDKNNNIIDIRSPNPRSPAAGSGLRALDGENHFRLKWPLTFWINNWR